MQHNSTEHAAQLNSTEHNCSGSFKLFNDSPIYIARSVILGLCFVLGVPGNVAALVILVRRLEENSFSIRLMLSLAVSDLLTLLLLPIWIWSSVNHWIFGSAACKIISYAEYWCTFCSGLCVTLMSIQRYMQVLHPQKWAKLGAKGRKGLLCGLWILSGLLSLYAPVQREAGCDDYGFQDCSQKFRSDTERVATSLFQVLLVVMCFLLLVLLYCLLYRGVNQSPFFSSNRMTKLVIRIVVAFLIFLVLGPFADALNIVAVLLKNDSLSKNANICAIIARALTCLNSCVNPFLYTFVLRELHPNNHLEQNT